MKRSLQQYLKRCLKPCFKPCFKPWLSGLAMAAVAFLHVPLEAQTNPPGDAAPQNAAQTTRAETGAAESGENPFISMEQLLEKVKRGRVRDIDMNEKRIAQFKQQRESQARRLKELEDEKQQAETLSRTLEENFNQNDETLADLEEKLDQRLGSIKTRWAAYSRAIIKTGTSTRKPSNSNWARPF